MNEAIFGITPNDHAIYLDVKQYMANQRQGTHKSKERSEISGSTRKLGRQKGGGGARRGDINSPLLVLLVGGARVFGPTPRDYWFKLNKKVKALARKSALSYKAQTNNIVVVEDFVFGGARVFGPTPRDYWFKLNKKVKALARKSALSYKAQTNNIVVVEDFVFEAPKTKDFVNVVNNLKVAGKKLLMVLPEANKNVYLSARNLERTNVTIASALNTIASALNTYTVLNAETLVVTEGALKAIEETLVK